MKLNKIITVMMLCGIGFTTHHSVHAYAATENTVISNKVTNEEDTSWYAQENETIVNVTTGSAVVNTGEAVVTSVVGGACSTFSELKESDLVQCEVLDSVTQVPSGDLNVESIVLKNDEQVAQQITTEPVVSKKSVSAKLSNTVTKTKEKSTKKKYTAAELKLMSSIIYCEAVGEPYAGKLAVGIVVMNRRSSKSFPNTLKGVIYQKYQFGPTRNGSLSKALKKYDAGQFKSAAERDCIRAAKAALEGTKKVTYKSRSHNLKTFHFFSTSVSGARLTIQNHQFK